MALDFGILQPANISGQLQAGQESAMRNQLAQQQLAAGQQQMETGRMQQEKAGLEMQQFRRRQSALDKFLSDAEKGGHTGDPEDVAKSFFNFAITNGDPSVVMAAQQALMAAKERKAYIASRMPGAPAMPVAPAGSEDRLGDFISQIEAKQNAPMPMPAVTGRPIQPEQALNVVSRSEGSPSPIPTANMLAPAAVAPANALAGPDTKALENEIFRLETQFANVPEAQKEAARLKERLKEFYTPRVVGNSLIVGNKPVYTAPERPFAPPSSVAEFERARTDPAFMQFLQDRAAAIRPPRPEAAPRTQQVTMSDGTLGIMNMDTGAVTPSTMGGVPVKGKPSAFAEKTAIQQKQLGVDINRTIGELEAAAAPGGLIEQSTGSGIGRAVDIGARVFGKAMPGDIAIGKLAPVADMVLKMVPRFEGPQSDKDTKSYKEAAGQLADATLPIKIRQAAAIEIVRLMKARKNQFRTSDMAAEGAGAAQIAPPAGFVPDQR